jgi:hypothetical protein
VCGEPVKAIEEKTTVVLAGAFNPAILRPQWVAVHGLEFPENEDFQVEMLTPVGGAGAPRFSFDGFSYSATLNNVILYLKTTDIDQCQRSIHAAANVLAKLPHTPVVGLGFNFGYLVEEPSQALLALMTTRDALTDSFPGNPEVVTRKWGNTVKWENSLVSIDCELAGGQATITLNFHYSTGTAGEAENILRTIDTFKKHQERAVAAARALTGEELEN